ncbi:hypothetical protein CVT25_005618 [Psilocybe cyanescens]|uniref:CRAL-TRIO domain-containing protein n=1 Tax=Psilocybe cyanescens TaxID=93625 RepID=A0A409X6F4_PSICY|nr:hypothetical protein CVT25_005618 [Psilocybe cyanescens]
MDDSSSAPSSASPSDSSLAHQLSGHLGNLNPTQEQALATFKDILTKANLYTPAVEGSDVVKASHDDATLLRFLRARNFNPVTAQKQFADTENWRKKHNVTKLYHGISPEDLDLSRRFYPRWTGRRDKLGLPLYVYRLASIILYEFMTRFTFPLCSHLPRATAPIPVSSTTTIIDLDNASFGSMWRLRTHLQEASRLSTSNYPETLHHIAIVNSPSFFPTIWNWIKGWFDEGTRKKIHVLGRDPGSALCELVHSRDLPAVYGGELEWRYEDEPHLDEDVKQVIGDFPKGPVVFVDGRVEQPSST